MTYGGRGDARDPFAEDPFDADVPPSTYGASPNFATPGYGRQPAYGPPVSYGPPGSEPPDGEVNKLATLSVVFAVVFAPAGAVLGHLALSEIKRRYERGRTRAVLGLTLSYAIMTLAVIALVVWLIVGNSRHGPPGAETPPPTVSEPPSTSVTVVTPPPRARPTVNVENLRRGDCVEIQNEEPAGQPNTDYIFIYRVRCEARSGVFQVEEMVSDRDQCTTQNAIFNNTRTVFACIADFRG